MTVQIETTGGIEVPTYDIMLDFDDVIIPWAQPVHDACELLGITNGKMFSSWHMWEDYGCTKEDWENAVIHATTNGLYTDTDPFPGAVEAVNGLMWRGHRVHIVTARGFMANGEQIQQWTRLALAKFGIGHSTLTFQKNKARAMDDLGVHFDYAIDDGVHNYETLVSRGVKTWLHTQRHNASAPVPDEHRVSSLWEFAQMIHTDQTTRSSVGHYKQRVIAGMESP